MYTVHIYFSVTGIFLVTDTPWSHAARIREVLLYFEPTVGRGVIGYMYIFSRVGRGVKISGKDGYTLPHLPQMDPCRVSFKP